MRRFPRAARACRSLSCRGTGARGWCMRRRGEAGESASVDAIRASLPQLASPLERGSDLDPLMERIGDARYVLLGEASHGTSEYYTWRSRITERLVREKGFSFVAVE